MIEGELLQPTSNAVSFFEATFIMRTLTAVITEMFPQKRFDSTTTGYISSASCEKLIYTSISMYEKERKIESILLQYSIK
jgi:hypothetical protein